MAAGQLSSGASGPADRRVYPCGLLAVARHLAPGKETGMLERERERERERMGIS